MKQYLSFAPIPTLPFLLVLIGLSIFLQTMVISYNAISGFYEIRHFSEFLSRLGFSSVLTFFLALSLAKIDQLVLQKIQFHDFEQNNIYRWFTIGLSTVVLGVVFSFLITVSLYLLGVYNHSFLDVFIINSFYFIISNALLVVLMEMWRYGIDHTTQKQRTLILQQELSQIKFEVLKNQLSPHFIFNSLNVLSALIDDNNQKAQTFLEEFAEIFRYVLQSIDKRLVRLEDELPFIQKYIHLQQQRYGEYLQISMSISSTELPLLLPPLALQTLLENAVKHNRISKEHPLQIIISTTSSYLTVRNRFQPKRGLYTKTKTGQKNLEKRFELLGVEIPYYEITETEYIARIPLLSQNEGL